MGRIESLLIKWPSRRNVELDAKSNSLAGRLSRYVDKIGDPELDRPIQQSPDWVAVLQRESR